MPGRIVPQGSDQGRSSTCPTLGDRQATARGDGIGKNAGAAGETARAT
jgi:hypothetical protein